MGKRFFWLSFILGGVLFIMFWQISRWLATPSLFEQSLKALREGATEGERVKALETLRRHLHEFRPSREEKERLLTLLADIAEKDEAERVRTFALFLLTELDGQKAVPLLMEALRRSSQEASLALQFLPRLADRTTWERLMNWYERERDPVLRDRLLRLLRHLPPRYLRDLCRRLGERPEPWGQVVPYLNGIKVKEIVGWALNEKAVTVQRGALRLLTHFLPDPKLALKLAPLLRHRDEGVKKLVAKIFAQVPSPKLIPFLRDALKDPALSDSVRVALLRLKALPVSEARRLLKDPDPRVRAQGIHALAESGKDWQRLKEALNDPDPWVVRNAAAALAAKGEKGMDIVLRRYRAELKWQRRLALLEGIASFPDPRVYALLVHLLRFGTWKEQMVAMTALAFHGDKILPTLKKLLRGSLNDRLAALQVLAGLRTKEAQRLLLKTAREDPHEKVRLEALRALSNYAPEEAFPLFAEVVREGDPESAEEAALALTRYGKRGQTLLKELLDSDNPIAKRAAAKALSALGDRKALVLLRELEGEGDGTIKRLSDLRLRAHLGDREAIRELIGLLDSPDPLFRLRVRATLFGIGRAAIPELIEALGSGKEVIRMEAALLLGALRAPSAREKLLTLTEDPDPKVRAAARSALQRLPFPP